MAMTSANTEPRFDLKALTFGRGGWRNYRDPTFFHSRAARRVTKQVIGFTALSGDFIGLNRLS